MKKDPTDYFLPPITECGIRFAGRKIVLLSLKSSKKIIWISNSKSNLSCYAPGWTEFGLEKIFFLKIENVMKEAKHVFLQPCFDTIVIDGFRNLKDDDLAFIRTQARTHKFQVILIRDFYLTPSIGNVWARSRFNIFYNPKKSIFKIERVKGVDCERYEVNLFQ